MSSTILFLIKKIRLRLEDIKHCFELTGIKSIEDDFDIEAFLVDHSHSIIYSLNYKYYTNISEYFQSIKKSAAARTFFYCLDLEGGDDYSKDSPIYTTTSFKVIFNIINTTRWDYVSLIVQDGAFDTSRTIDQALVPDYLRFYHFMTPKMPIFNAKELQISYSPLFLDSYDPLLNRQNSSSVRISKYYDYYTLNDDRILKGQGKFTVRFNFKSDCYYIRREYMNIKELFILFVGTNKILSFLILVFRFLFWKDYFLMIPQENNSFLKKRKTSSENLTANKITLTEFWGLKALACFKTEDQRQRMKNYEKLKELLQASIDLSLIFKLRNDEDELGENRNSIAKLEDSLTFDVLKNDENDNAINNTFIVNTLNFPF